MKLAAKIFDMIGLVSNAVAIVTYVLILALQNLYIDALFIFLAEEGVDTGNTIDIFRITLNVTCGVLLLFNVLAIIVCAVAYNKLNLGSKDKAPHIILIAGGVSSQNLTYVAGGVLGLIASIKNK